MKLFIIRQDIDKSCKPWNDFFNLLGLWLAPQSMTIINIHVSLLIHFVYWINTLWRLSHGKTPENTMMSQGLGIYNTHLLPCSRSRFLQILFDLILYVPSTIFQLCRDGSPGLNQYLARINVSCPRTKHSDASEVWARSPSFLSQAPYHWTTVLPVFTETL